MVRGTRAALLALRVLSARRSSILGSIAAATTGLPQRVLYSASKGAVAAMTRAMAADLLPEGIRVNAVNPGTAGTPWIGRLLDRASDPAAEYTALAARQPHGRLVAAEEVAAAIAYLASPTPGRPGARAWPWTAAWTACGCARRGEPAPCTSTRIIMCGTWRSATCRGSTAVRSCT
jgi:NAD(P)-dependent dehydrogenase (short-subunit alcohol dehydrogenase family)